MADAADCRCSTNTGRSGSKKGLLLLMLRRAQTTAATTTDTHIKSNLRWCLDAAATAEWVRVVVSCGFSNERTNERTRPAAAPIQWLVKGGNNNRDLSPSRAKELHNGRREELRTKGRANYYLHITD